MSYKNFWKEKKIEMNIGKQISKLEKTWTNQINNLVDDYNRFQIEVGKLEAVSGFSIGALIKMFAEGYTLKK